MAIVACDTIGNVAAFSADGVMLWDRVVSGSVSQVTIFTLCRTISRTYFTYCHVISPRIWFHVMSQAPTLADLNGDGTLEVVCATSAGDIVVLNGKDGTYLPNFPVRTGDRIISPVLVLPFPEDELLGGSKGEYPMPRLLVPSFDGLVYIVSSQTGCTDWVDIGEQAYSMPLAGESAPHTEGEPAEYPPT